MNSRMNFSEHAKRVPGWILVVSEFLSWCTAQSPTPSYAPTWDPTPRPGTWCDDLRGQSTWPVTPAVAAIPENAYERCLVVEVIRISDTVSTLGDSSFYECVDLHYIFIPHGVQELGSSVFKGCQMLNNVILPASIRHIGTDAFAGTRQLTSIVIPGTPNLLWRTVAVGHKCLYYPLSHNDNDNDTNDISFQ